MLDTLLEFRRAFYQAVGSVSTDAALVEQGEAVNEIADRLCTMGIRNAQQYMIDIGGGGLWRTTSPVLTWSGSDETGGFYTVLPTDPLFLRLAGDDRKSAIRSPAGVRWGVLIDERERYDYRSSPCYYLMDYEGQKRLWRTIGAVPPAGVVMDYFYAHPELTDDADPIDMAESDRPLGVAEAAVLAIGESWFTGDGQDEQRLYDRQRAERRLAASRIRRTRTPRRLRSKQGTGTHFFYRG